MLMPEISWLKGLVQLVPKSSPRVCGRSSFPMNQPFACSTMLCLCAKLTPLSAFPSKKPIILRIPEFWTPLEGRELIINDIITPAPSLVFCPVTGSTSVAMHLKASRPLPAPYGPEVTLKVPCSLSRQLLLLGCVWGEFPSLVCFLNLLGILLHIIFSIFPRPDTLFIYTSKVWDYTSKVRFLTLLLTFDISFINIFINPIGKNCILLLQCILFDT